MSLVQDFHILMIVKKVVESLSVGPLISFLTFIRDQTGVMGQHMERW